MKVLTHRDGFVNGRIHQIARSCGVSEPLECELGGYQDGHRSWTAETGAVAGCMMIE